MKTQIGQYYYGRHYNIYGVWQVKDEYSATFVQDFIHKEEAREFVYQMNGWKL